MSDLRIDPDSLAAAAGRLAQGAADIQARLDDLTLSANLLRHRWSGAAAEAFDCAKAAWDVDMARLRAILAEAAERARAGAVTYDRADRAVAAIWSI